MRELQAYGSARIPCTRTGQWPRPDVEAATRPQRGRLDCEVEISAIAADVQPAEYQGSAEVSRDRLNRIRGRWHQVKMRVRLCAPANVAIPANLPLGASNFSGISRGRHSGAQNFGEFAQRRALVMLQARRRFTPSISAPPSILVAQPVRSRISMAVLKASTVRMALGPN